MTGLVMIITFAFCVGDIDEVGFPFIQVFLNATGSVSARRKEDPCLGQMSRSDGRS
jgi:hypothetical protein